MAREPAIGSNRHGREDSGEQPIELRRQLDALRRWRWPIALIVLAITGAALALSLVLPKSYVATARVLYDPTQVPVGPQDDASVHRELSTLSSLITTPSILRPVARRHHLSVRNLEKKVSTSVDQTTELIAVSGRDHKARGASSIANDVARTFIKQRASADRKSIEATRARIDDQISRLGAVPGSAAQIDALKAKLSDLDVAFANAGSEVQMAEPARTPSGPASPRPVRNTLLALFGSTFLAVLLALGRDQLVPRVAGPRELTRITDRPVLGGIPFVRRRFGRYPKVLTAAEHEAYQTLQATIRFQLPPDEQHIILVTSALEGEGKTSVTINLGRALARAGQKTLVVSADMRRPKLHELVDMPAAPGLSEILGALDRNGDASVGRTMSAVKSLLNSNAGAKGNLHVLASGKKPSDPARLLLSNALPALFEQLRAMDYAYVLLDGTPLLGIADAQVMAQRVDDVMIVSRLDRLTTDNAIEMRDLLDRLEVTPLGHVVVGVRRSTSYYYATTAPETERV